tara:strand:- start:30 stop:164 length:135 start_codon:yes stop_codon:yes gene_type:complete
MKIECLIKELESNIKFCQWHCNEEEVDDALYTLQKLKEAINQNK